MPFLNNNNGELKLNKNPYDIKLVAMDMDGTFARSDYTYDIPRFKEIMTRMKDNDCQFVVASGNQYYQLRSLFPGYYNELSFVAENGAFVKDREDMLFSADISRDAIVATLELLKKYPEVKNVMCGLERLVQRWGINPKQCIAFGDGNNDLEMISYCGRGYAMENAPDNVKKAADYICPSNDEDGVLVILDQLFPKN